MFCCRVQEVLIQKLQENEQLKYELSELQSRLDAVSAAPLTEELGPRPLVSSEARHDAVSGQPDSYISLVSVASESIDGNNCYEC